MICLAPRRCTYNLQTTNAVRVIGRALFFNSMSARRVLFMLNKINKFQTFESSQVNIRGLYCYKLVSLSIITNLKCISGIFRKWEQPYYGLNII